MKPGKESVIIKFLRTYKQPFTLSEMKKVFKACGVKADTQEVHSYLESNPNVLTLSNGSYLTLAGAFSGEIFSIMPTAAESEQGVLVPGHRCMPFVESDRISSTLKFYINGKKIPSKVGVFDSDAAIDMFMLHGEEYAPQYIAADPANADINMAERDFELPNSVKLTGINLDYLAEHYNYRKGDRILCCVSDWDKGTLNVMVLHSGDSPFDKGIVGEKRLEWYTYLEKKLLESMDREGPLESIEQQLVNVIFNNRQKLCVPYCGSIEEYIKRYAKKISFQHYGVETRLWHKDQDVPAFGEWNKSLALCTGSRKDKGSFESYTIEIIPDLVYDQFVCDAMFLKKKNVADAFLEYIFPGNEALDDSLVRDVALNMGSRIDIISKNYNWFADQILGPLRSRCLEVYRKVSTLVRRIDFDGKTFLDFPQNELVILLQLHNHVLKMLESLATDPQTEEFAESLQLSLDGMEWNFEEISVVLESALAKEQRSQFKVLR